MLVRSTKGSSSESEGVGLVAYHVLSVSQQDGWIVDSGATSHMCNDQNFFRVASPRKALGSHARRWTCAKCCWKWSCATGDETTKWKDAEMQTV